MNISLLYPEDRGSRLLRNIHTWLPNCTLLPSMVDKTASSERLVPVYWTAWPQFHPAEGSNLLENVCNCTTPHGITSHNTLIFNTVVKPSDLQHRGSKEKTITFEEICKYHAAKLDWQNQHINSKGHPETWQDPEVDGKVCIAPNPRFGSRRRRRRLWWWWKRR